MAGARKRRGVDVSELRTGTITALSAKGARGERVAVYVDGERAFDVSALVVDNAGLRKDAVLTAEQQAELLRADEPYRAREAALGMLGRRDLPGAQIASKLRDMEISEQQIQPTIAWLQEFGYVDDARYAAAYTSTKTQAGWGRRRILSELYRKGVDRGVAEAAWQTWTEQGREVGVSQQLIELVQKRFGRQLESDPQGARRRISGFLARRGHDWDTIAAVLSAVRPGDDSLTV